MANTQLSEVDLKELTAALAELSESGMARDEILKAYREIASPDLDSRVSDAFGHALIKLIDATAKSGWILPIVTLFKEEHLPENLRARLEPALLEGIEVCAKEGTVIYLATLFEKEPLPEKARARLEPALLEAMEVCAKKGRIDRLVTLYKVEGLPEKTSARLEPALMEGIDAWSELYSTGSGALHLSEKMFSVISELERLPEAVSLKIIEVCSKPEQIHFVETLLDLGGLSEEVYLKGIAACAKAGETKAIAALLQKRENLPPSALDAAERATKGVPPSPKDVLSRICAQLKSPPEAPKGGQVPAQKIRRGTPGA